MSTPADPPDGARAPDTLFDQVYLRLKAMAGRQLARGGRTPTLDTTALVHDAYLRMVKNEGLRFDHEAQFFAYAAHAMRHLLADHARDRMRASAGGDWQRVTLADSLEECAIDSAEEALRLDAAIEKLAATDARAAQVIELRYFAGLSLEQAADALGVARRTVDRDWRFARAFLKHELY